MWMRLFPYARMAKHSAEYSDYIDPRECTPQLSRAVRAFILLKGAAYGLRKRDHKRVDVSVFQNHILGNQPIRYLEKTIANCFHVDAIERLFPDALYIHLVRDGRACISSMMESWPIFVKKLKPALTFPSDSTVSVWSYGMPPNWYGVTPRSLEEICAWSWIEHNRYILEKVEHDPEFQQKYLKIKYEDFLNAPERVLEQVTQFGGFTASDDCLDFIRQRNLSWTTISAPRKNKWRDENYHEIERILPTITPMMARLGYEDFD